MRTKARFPWPQRTTVLAGALLLVSGVLLLMVSVRLAVPVTNSFVIPLSGPVVSFAAAIVRVAAFVVAAFGVAGEVGIAGHSTIGRSALAVWGLRDLVFLTLALAPLTTTPVVASAGLALNLVFAIAALASAILVLRARVLWGAARWVWLLVAIIECAFVAVSDPLPFATDAALRLLLALAAWPLEYVEPVLTLAIAVSLLLWGRVEAVKHRARLVHDAW